MEGPVERQDAGRGKLVKTNDTKRDALSLWVWNTENVVVAKDTEPGGIEGQKSGERDLHAVYILVYCLF